MGNFDGNTANDFLLPNGTILTGPSVDSERNIYNNFGQACKSSFWICNVINKVIPENTRKLTLQYTQLLLSFFSRQYSVCLLGSISANTSIFHYDTGLSHDNYTHPDFLPFFIDEFSEEKQNQSKRVCGESQACIFDFLATGDRTLAVASGNEQSTSESNTITLGKIFELSKPAT